MRREEISRFYQRFRLYIYPLVVGLSTVFMIVFVIYPQTAKLFDNQKVQEDLNNKSQFLEAKAATLEALDDSDLSKKVGYVLSAYPSEPDFVNILGILQNVANQNGFSISALSVNPTTSTSGGSQKYSVKMDAVGSRNLLPRFITSIESSGRLVRVKGIDISPGKGGDSISVNLDIEVLYALIPSGLGGTADTPLPALSDKDEQLITTLATFSPATPVTAPTQESNNSNNKQVTPRGRANPFE